MIKSGTPFNQKEYSHAYYERNKIRMAAYRKAYYLKHKIRLDECRRQWVARHREKMFAYKKEHYEAYKSHCQQRDWLTHIKRKYGLTKDDYEGLLMRQGGACAICHRLNRSGHRLSVDHDHSTGHVRGLLCQSCNRFVVSVVEHYHDRIASAMEYLAKHNNLIIKE